MNQPHIYSMMMMAVVILLSSCGFDMSREKGGSSDMEKGTPPKYDVFDGVNVDGNHGSNDSMDTGTSSTVDENIDNEVILSEPLEIEWPRDLEDFVGSISSLTHWKTLYLPPLEGENSYPCCFDFGRASKRPGIDNALAQLNFELVDKNLEPSELAEDISLINSDLEEAFLGQTQILLEHRFFEDIYLPSGLEGEKYVTSLVEASPSTRPTDYYVYSEESERFWNINPNSFKKYEETGTTYMTGEPISFANPSVVVKGNFFTHFDQITLPIPIHHIIVHVPIKNVRLIAKVAPQRTPNLKQMNYQEGTLSGYVSIDDIFNALNSYVVEHCGCDATGHRPIYFKAQRGTWVSECDASSDFACRSQLSPECKQLLFSNTPLRTDISRPDDKPGKEFLCHALPQLIHSAADIDQGAASLDPNVDETSNAQTWDALSVGFHWKGQPIKIQHVR